ncbi:transcription elongation factor B polypeptide 3-like [Venturia canescens]|uniref:transcription elongation factor B polypeptide 3-like n=1 Tax=Venturia canescens TaxID=32260 RepID=UPI001C9C3EED|nr:transcription elongation factor B polypeptide 3-like [Venturia canescens]
MSVVDKIQHYQRSLERCTDDGSRTLHCIEKLYRLPVTVQHLQETGVGRTVNALRKYDGSIGDAAKALVAKWKTMVVDEDTSDCDDEDEACVPDAPEGYSDHSNSPKPEKNNKNQSSRNSSKHRSAESGEKSRHSEKHESRHSMKTTSAENSKSRENETKTSRESDERHKTSKNGIDRKKVKSEEKSSKSTKESKNELGKHESSREEGSSRSSATTSSANTKIKTEEERKNSSKVSSTSGSGNHSGTSKDRSKSHDSQRKRKLDASLNEKESSKKRISLESPDDTDRVCNEGHDSIDDDDDDRPTQIISRDSDNESGRNQPDTCFNSDSDDSVLKKKIKREILDSPSFGERRSVDYRNSQNSEKSSKSKNRDNTDKYSSSTSEKLKRDNDKRERSKADGEISGHRKNEKRKDDTTRNQNKESSSKLKSQTKSSSSSKDHSSKDKDDVRRSSKNKKDDKSDTSGKDSREQFKEPMDKKIKKKKISEDDGIDCNSGASFAEALGMCQDRPSSRKKNPVSPTSPMIKTIKTEPGTSSSSSSSSMPSSSRSTVKVKSEFPTSNDSQALSLLAPNIKLEPLNVDLASTLPEISPNYKPLPAHYINPIHRKQDEDKALSDVIYTKGQRTKVYSGNKSGYTTVPSLCEVCIRVLIQHMDALGFTGGIPYDILKPVLERAMPDQLFTLENYNPYLIEDTDSLWQFHCNREFREKRREEMESWRDMYMRCRDEREVKLKALTANIKESIDKSVPVRSTKLAYVDNIVKPPRNVLRNQAKYGTAKSSTSSSDLKKKLILSGSSTSATNIAVPPPPMSRMKTAPSNNGKKNKAPLMAKALQLIKSRYKR